MHGLMVLHLILSFSLTIPVTPLSAASSEHGLSTGNCSHLGVTLQRCKQPETLRHLCWEERAGLCFPRIPSVGGDPSAQLLLGIWVLPPCSYLQAPVLLALLQ